MIFRRKNPIDQIPTAELQRICLTRAIEDTRANIARSETLLLHLLRKLARQQAELSRHSTIPPLHHSTTPPI